MKMKGNLPNLDKIDQTKFPIPVTFEGKVVGFANSEGEINFLSKDDAQLVMDKLDRPIGISSRKNGKIDKYGRISEISGVQELTIIKTPPELTIDATETLSDRFME
jgi:hypothetical protein